MGKGPSDDYMVPLSEIIRTVVCIDPQNKEGVALRRERNYAGDDESALKSRV